MKLLVIDGNSIVNRAFYGIKLLTTRSGQYTNAITGFMNILLRLQTEHKPDEIAIAFDLKAPTFRHKMFDGYKAQRKGMPEELASQMPLLKELLSHLGYQQVVCEGFEADDILGTLSAACAARGDVCLLATGDRDSLQLIDATTTVLLAGNAPGMGKSVTTVMDEAAVHEKYGLSPAQLIDVKSLMGDASDNIPGVAGIGEKTALALIQSFGSLDGVYAHLDDASIKPGVREKLTQGKQQAEMSRTLAAIVRDAPVETAAGAYAAHALDAPAAAKLLQGLEMYTMVKKLGLESAGLFGFTGQAGASFAGQAAGAGAVSGGSGARGEETGANGADFAGGAVDGAAAASSTAAALAASASGTIAPNGLPAAADSGEDANGQLTFGSFSAAVNDVAGVVTGNSVTSGHGASAAAQNGVDRIAAPVRAGEAAPTRIPGGAPNAASAAGAADSHASNFVLNPAVQAFALALPPMPDLSALSGVASLCLAPQAAGAAGAELAEQQVLIVNSEAIYTESISSEALLALLESGDIEKRCFDAKPLYRAAFTAHRSVRALTFDAKLAAYLLQPDARDYTIAQLAMSYGVAPGFAAPCAEAVEATALPALCDALAAACREAGMDSLLRDIEQPLCEVLASMEHEGVLVDKSGIEAFGKELQAALDKELAFIYEAVGYEFNVNSPKQLGRALFESLGLPTGKKTKSGYSTNAETLEALREHSPVVEHILLYRTYQKLNSTYVEGMLKVVGADDRVHSTFNQTETRTGRISSGEPNLQNIPVRTELGSRLRKYFIAPKGYTLLDADYSQIELRILAHIANDEAMLDTFARGADIHRSTAAKIYGVTEDEVTASMRSSAKAVNFGIVYGIGAFSLSKDIGVSVKEADMFIKSYLGSFPGVQRYMEETVSAARENGYVTTLYGRRRSLPEINNSNFNVRALGERMAMNTPIQGTAADIIKLAMVRVYRRLAAEGLAAKLILQVHDELIVECPEAERARASAVLGEEMSAAAQLRVALLADVNSGDSWYDAKG